MEMVIQTGNDSMNATAHICLLEWLSFFLLRMEFPFFVKWAFTGIKYSWVCKGDSSFALNVLILSTHLQFYSRTTAQLVKTNMNHNKVHELTNSLLKTQRRELVTDVTKR